MLLLGAFAASAGERASRVRHRKSAAERRGQSYRAEGRSVQGLLRAFAEIARHPGNKRSTLAAALVETLGIATAGWCPPAGRPTEVSLASQSAQVPVEPSPSEDIAGTLARAPVPSVDATSLPPRGSSGTLLHVAGSVLSTLRADASVSVPTAHPGFGDTPPRAVGGSCASEVAALRSVKTAHYQSADSTLQLAAVHADPRARPDPL
jgi:hypothetical protein